MYGGAFAGFGRDLQIRHKALHNGKAHAASLAAAGGEHGCSCLGYIRNANAFVFDNYIQDLPFQYPATDGDNAQFCDIIVLY